MDSRVNAAGTGTPGPTLPRPFVGAADECHDALDALPDPVFILAAVRDAAGAVVDLEYRFVNAAGLKLYGRSGDEVIGHGLLELFPSVRGSSRWSTYLGVLDTGTPATAHPRDFDDGGLRGSFALGATRFRDGLIIVARDVTDRVRAEEDLRSERDLITAMLDVAGALVVLTDTDGRILRLNRESEKLIGYREAEVVGRTYESFMPEAEHAFVAANLARVPVDRPVSDEKHVLTKDGASRLIRWSYSALPDNSGRPKHIVAVGVDITEQRQLEDQLRQERDFVATMLDVAGSLIAVVDGEWRFVRFNRQCEVVSGYRAEEVLGRRYDFFIPSSERASVAEVMNMAAAARHPITQVNHIITKAGELRSIRWSHAGLVDAEGHRSHVMIVGIDVTDQQRAEAELVRRAAELDVANKELARSNADLEQFAHSASHDLREPLRSISGPLTVIANRYQGRLDETADQFFDFALSGCRRMEAMIDGLLLFARMGRADESFVWTDAGRAAREAVAALGPTLSETGAIVAVDDLPFVLAEPNQLSMVFQNLIGNAVKFVAPGVVPRVRVSAGLDEGCWRFSVVDNGIGVAPEQRARAFTMFKRLNPSDEYAGSGIGLALVKRIVERHGGEVGVDDAPDGDGSLFWFTLPTTAQTPD